MLKMTLTTMDKAKRYIEATGETTFKIQADTTNWDDNKYWASVSLSAAVKKDNLTASVEARDEFTNEILTKVATLMS